MKIKHSVHLYISPGFTVVSVWEPINIKQEIVHELEDKLMNEDFFLKKVNLQDGINTGLT